MEPAAVQEQERVTALRAIDVDLHHHIANWQEVAPYAPEGLRHRLARASGPPLARHGFKIIGPRFGEAPTPTDAMAKRVIPLPIRPGSRRSTSTSAASIARS